MKVRLLLLCGVLMLVNLSVHSQHNTSSPYSRYGLGDISPIGYGQNEAMGGTCIGVQDPFHVNNGNPAAIASLPPHTFLFELGAANRYSIHQSNTATQRKNSANLRYFAAGFTFKPWWHSSVGLNPLTDVGYNMEDYAKIDNNNILQSNYTGTGGLSQTFWTNSFTLFNRLSIGVTSSFVFGGADYTATRTLSWGVVENNAADIHKSLITQNRSYFAKGLYFNMGAQYKQLIKDDMVLVVGGTFSNKTKLKSDIQNYITRTIAYSTTSVTDVLKGDSVENKNIELPQTWGVGASLNYKYKYIFSADYSQQNWKDVTLWDETSLMNQRLNNSQTLAVGFQYMPRVNSPQYWDAVRYRAGFRYTKTSLFLNNNQIKDMAITCGIALPFSSYSSLVNISFEVGKRGTSNDNLIEEKYIIMSLNITLNDKWFYKRLFY